MEISIREFNKNITKWLNYGKPLIITKNNKPLVNIIPVATIDEGCNSPSSVATPKKPKIVATPKPQVSDNSVKPIKTTAKNNPSYKNIQRIIKAPRTCPKHGGAKIGDKYSCGCKV